MSGWEPPSVLEERLKNALVPPALYYRFRAHRELRRGERELGLLPYLLDRRRNSVDVGANKGVYTYWLQRYSRHVHAYEPNPKMFRLLEAGAGGNVTVLPVALSNANGRARLRVPQTAKGYSNQGASLNHEKVGATYGEVEVETRRLDDEGLCDVGFIKIDVEGHEFAVLEGARETIARDRPTLLIEIEETHNKMPIEDSLARVADLGYDGFALIGGSLKSLAFFDAEAHHRAPARREDYVFNFLFFARER
ncbi:MAG: FkbM family methyltransferase [Alphaproteobacteria bacterium]